MIEMRQLRYFLVVAEEQNLRRASAKLHVDQSAVSRQIQDMEEQLGFPLFERLPRGIRLSAAGQAYAEQVKLVFSDLERAKELAQTIFLGQSGSLSLGTHEVSLHHPVVLESLRQFKIRHPKIDLKLEILNSQRQFTAACEKNEIEGGFSSEPPDEYDLNNVRAAQDAVALFTSSRHPLSKQDSITLADLAGETLIHLPFPSASLGRQLRARGFKTKRTLEVASTDAVFSLLEAGLGVAILAISLTDRASKHVAFRPISDFSPVVTHSFVWPRRPPSAPLLSFLEVLKSVTGEPQDRPEAAPAFLQPTT
jgi:DNA-binding transcriptional LysR family regulator